MEVEEGPDEPMPNKAKIFQNLLNIPEGETKIGRPEGSRANFRTPGSIQPEHRAMVWSAAHRAGAEKAIEAERDAFKTIPLQASMFTKLSMRGEEKGPGEYVLSQLHKSRGGPVWLEAKPEVEGEEGKLLSWLLWPMAKGRNKPEMKGACSLAAAGIISPLAPRTVKTGNLCAGQTKTGGAWNSEGYLSLVCHGGKCFRITWTCIEGRWQSAKNQHMTMSSKFSFGTPEKLDNSPCKADRGRTKKEEQRSGGGKARARSHSEERRCKSSCGVRRARQGQDARRKQAEKERKEKAEEQLSGTFSFNE